MKNTFLVIALLFITTIIVGQAPMTADQKADETVSKLKKDLSLTDEQIPKVKAITVDRITKITTAKKKNGADKPRMQADSNKIFAEWETQLKGILNEEQYTKYLSSKNK